MSVALGIVVFLMIIFIASVLFSTGYRNQRKDDDEDRDSWDQP